MISKTLVINKARENECYVEITEREYDNNDRVVSEKIDNPLIMTKEDIIKMLDEMPIGNLADVCHRTWQLNEEFECDGCTI